ncbi:MAG: hypothetical protein S4CHLAM37_03330 [Chlamydiia bacterium]|nr:hypothetical protein [Chlamydiia bacterium]
MNTMQKSSEEEKKKTSNVEKELQAKTEVKKTSALAAFKDELEKQESAEERLKMSIEFMRNSISQNKAPRFKDFWEAKKLCLPLFKEKINPALKAKFWTEYTELSTEAKRLKEILDEQSSFSMEQLELALKALETDLEKHEQMVKALPELKLPEHAETLQKNIASYSEKQKYIQYYMTLTARVKELRKEIISTEMRIRHKNKLLKKLSDVGDRFIPKKKEQIKAVSESFVADVKWFSGEFFDLEEKKIKGKDVALFKLREEIKAFQSAAKLISLNSQAFSASRLLLSECWECVKSADKERKKSLHEKKESFKKQVEEAKALIEEFEKDLTENPPSSKDVVQSKGSELSRKLKEIHLHRDDVKRLRSLMKKVQDKALEPFEAKEREHAEKRALKEKQREEELSSFRDLCETLVNEQSSHSLKEYQDLYESFDQKKKELKPSEHEKRALGELKREIFETILLKRVSEISDFESQREEAEKLFADWENFKEETRARVEAYRKEQGSSGFDFEKAMIFNELVDAEKARLDRAIEKVELLEDKLGL